VAVTDEQVAALRAFLAPESDDAEQLTEQLIESKRLAGYGELVYAAFVSTLRRRFSPAWTVSAVIRFVAVTRAELLEDAIDIDPRTAEVLIRRALGDGVVTDLDEEARARAQIFLLCAMVADAEFDDAELDTFLAQSRSLAEQLTA
jgi:hypothetical protein